MKISAALATALLAASLPGCAHAAEGGVFSGYYTCFGTAAVPHRNAGKNTLFSISNRLRLRYARETAGGTFNAAYSIAPRVQDRSLYDSAAILFSVDTHQAAFRAIDIPSPVYGPDGMYAVYQNLDRLFHAFSAGRTDIVIGRQAIAWGSARSVNPTDMFAPLAFNDLDAGERRGVDAVRVRVADGSFGEWDFGYVAGRDFLFSDSAVFLRTKLDSETPDLSLLFMHDRTDITAGIDIAGTVGGAGVWLEAAYGFAPDDSALRASVGSDYHIAGTLYGYLEYHFNGAGSDETENYRASLARPTYRKGITYLLGRHYIIPGISWQATPLATVSASVVANCTDGSSSFNPSIEHNVFQNGYVAVGAFMGIGSVPLSSDSTAPLLSEFGAYPDVYYSSFRVYF